MTLQDINFEELFAKEGFETALNAAATVEEVKAAFAAQGVTVTEEEAKEIFKGVHQEMGELSEEALDDVAGGGVGAVLAAIITAGGAVTVGTGVLIVGGVVFAGATALTAYNTYKRMKNGK